MLFVGGSGITSAQNVNDENVPAEVQADDSQCADELSKGQAKKAAKNATDDCEVSDEKSKKRGNKHQDAAPDRDPNHYYWHG